MGEMKESNKESGDRAVKEFGQRIGGRKVPQGMEKRNEREIEGEGNEYWIKEMKTCLCVCMWVSVHVSDRYFNQRRFVLETLPGFHYDR